MPFELINPKGLEEPVGYAHIAKITGGTMFRVAGQAPFDERGQVVGKGDFVAKFTQVMRNLKPGVKAVAGRTTNNAERTFYKTRLEYYGNKKNPFGPASRAVFEKYFPAIT